MENSLFISTEELQSLISSNSVQVVDSGMNTKDQHFQKRIPGAKYFSITEVKNNSSPLSQELPTLPEAVEYAKRLGIKNDGSTVVVYDQSGFMMAGRGWFFFKHFGYPNVKILDGGLAKWTAEGRATISGEYNVMGNTNWRVEDYQLVESQEDRIFQTEVTELVQRIASSQSQSKIWDPRPLEVYNQGTVTTAVNIPIGTFFNPDKTVKSKDEVLSILETRFENGEIITSCMKGNIACLALALLRYAGKNNSRVYSGSFEEWSSLKGH